MDEPPSFESRPPEGIAPPGADGSGEPPPDVHRRGPLRVTTIALGVVVAVLFAAATCVAAILSFDANPAGPAIVAVATIGVGSLSVRRLHDPALKAAAIGLVVGGVATVLLWPLFSVDSPTIGALLA